MMGNNKLAIDLAIGITSNGEARLIASGTEPQKVVSAADNCKAEGRNKDIAEVFVLKNAPYVHRRSFAAEAPEPKKEEEADKAPEGDKDADKAPEGDKDADKAPGVEKSPADDNKKQPEAGKADAGTKAPNTGKGGKKN